MKNHRPYVNFLRQEEWMINQLAGGPVRPTIPTNNKPPTKILKGVRLTSGAIRVSR